MTPQDSTATTVPTRSGMIRDPARFRTRLLAWLGGAVAAVIVWIIAVPIAGADLRATVGSTEQEIVLGAVVGATLVFGGLGWALLSLLERFFARARTIWLGCALVALVLEGANAAVAAESTEAVIWLNVMHLAVAAVLVPPLARTSPRR